MSWNKTDDRMALRKMGFMAREDEEYKVLCAFSMRWHQRAWCQNQGPKYWYLTWTLSWRRAGKKEEIVYEARVCFRIRVRRFLKKLGAGAVIKKFLKIFLFIFLIYFLAYIFTLYKHIPNLRVIVDLNPSHNSQHYRQLIYKKF